MAESFNGKSKYEMHIPIICNDFAGIAKQIKCQSQKIIIFDGLPGLYWDNFIETILKYFTDKKISVIKFDLKREDIGLSSILENSEQGYCKLIQKEDLDIYRNKIEIELNYVDFIFIYGVGSGILADRGCLFWMNVAKEIIHLYAKNHEIKIFNQKMNDDEFTNFWIINIRSHFESLVNKIIYYCDITNSNKPILISFGELKEKIKQISQQPFRTKAIISPSIWGGHWLLQNVYKDSHLKKIGWSYVFLPSESDIEFEYKDGKVDIPFDLLMILEPEAILGKDLVGKFGNEFPVRINITDTMGGGDLSCQVHPTSEFSRIKYGKQFKEYETYFILKTKIHSKIYLGLNNKITKDDFKHAVDQSVFRNKKIKISDFINSWKSRKRQLYYVLPGSVHFIGRNNLVMEIISSSIIHTFRFYDHLRMDENGNKRELNIEDALKVLDDQINTDFVKNNLKPNMHLSRMDRGHQEYSYDNLPAVPMKIILLKIKKNNLIQINKRQYHLLTLVEGKSIRIHCKNKYRDLGYLETILIPACIDEYWIENKSHKKVEILEVTS